MAEFSLFINLNETEELFVEFDEYFEAVNPSRFLDPLTGKKWRYQDRFRQIDAIIKDEAAKGTPASHIWVTYTDIPRKNIWPEANPHGAPHGIYGYPAAYVVDKKGNVPYGGSREFMLVFRVKGPVLAAEKWTKPGPKGTEKKIEKFSDRMRTLGDELDKSNFTNYLQEIKVEIGRKSIMKWESEQSKAGIPSDVISMIRYLLDIYLETLFKDIIQKRIDIKKNPASIEDIKTEKIFKKIFDKKKDNIQYEITTFFQYGHYKYETTVLPTLEENPFDEFKIKLSTAFEKTIKDNLDKIHDPVWHRNAYREWRESGLSPSEAWAKIKNRAKRIKEKYQKYEEYIGKYIPIEKLIEWEKDSELHSNRNKAEIIERELNKYKAERALYNSTNLQKFVEKMWEKIKEEIKDFTYTELKTKFPFHEKLKTLAKKYDLDLNQALQVGRGNTTPTAFVYKVTRNLADQMANKTDSNRHQWWVQWNKFLKELGIKSIVDPKGTATIHTGEATQGAFLDPTHIEPIAVIPNKIGIDPQISSPALTSQEDIYNYFIKQGYPHENALEKARGFTWGGKRKLLTKAYMDFRKKNFSPKLAIEKAREKIKDISDRWEKEGLAISSRWSEIGSPGGLVSTRLNTDISPEDTTIRVGHIRQFPPPPFLVIIEDEMLLVRSVDKDTNEFKVVRGVGETEAKPHRLGHSIYLFKGKRHKIGPPKQIKRGDSPILPVPQWPIKGTTLEKTLIGINYRLNKSVSQASLFADYPHQNYDETNKALVFAIKLAKKFRSLQAASRDRLKLFQKIQNESFPHVIKLLNYIEDKLSKVLKDEKLAFLKSKIDYLRQIIITPEPVGTPFYTKAQKPKPKPADPWATPNPWGDLQTIPTGKEYEPAEGDELQTVPTELPF